MKINTVEYNKGYYRSELILKPDSYNQQLDELVERLLTPPKEILLKEKIGNYPFQVLFIELGRIKKSSFRKDSQLITAETDKVHGATIIICNQEVQGPFKDRGELVKCILKNSVKELQGEPVCMHLKNILSNCKMLKPNLIFTLNPQNLSERTTKKFIERSVKPESKHTISPYRRKEN